MRSIVLGGDSSLIYIGQELTSLTVLNASTVVSVKIQTRKVE
jgi:hypothetical protein